MHQPFDLFRELDERAVPDHVGDLPFEDVAGLVIQCELGKRRRSDLLEGQGNLSFGRIHSQHHGFHQVARLDHFTGMVDPAGPTHLGDGNEAGDTRFQLHEGAERFEFFHLALDALSQHVPVANGEPGIGDQFLEAETDALLFHVQLDDLHINFLADLDDLRRFFDFVPGKIGDVNQAFHAAQIHKDTVTGESGHFALDHLADADLAPQVVLEAVFLFLQQGATGYDQLAQPGMEFHDAELFGAAHPGVGVFDKAEIDL